MLALVTTIMHIVAILRVRKVLPRLRCLALLALGRFDALLALILLAVPMCESSLLSLLGNAMPRSVARALGRTKFFHTLSMRQRKFSRRAPSYSARIPKAFVGRAASRLARP